MFNICQTLCYVHHMYNVFKTCMSQSQLPLVRSLIHFSLSTTCRPQQKHLSLCATHILIKWYTTSKHIRSLVNLLFHLARFIACSCSHVLPYLTPPCSERSTHLAHRRAAHPRGNSAKNSVRQRRLGPCTSTVRPHTVLRRYLWSCTRSRCAGRRKLHDRGPSSSHSKCCPS